jgi:ribosome-associated heat shock protein Hsp15
MIRLFKTRSLAAEACNAGKVRCAGNRLKPSKEVKAGEVYHVRVGDLEKTVKAIAAPKSRIGAAMVPQYYEDLTPPEEYDRVKALHAKFEYREHGEGRPTKRERRQIEYLKNYYGEEKE